VSIELVVGETCRSGRFGGCGKGFRLGRTRIFSFRAPRIAQVEGRPGYSGASSESCVFKIASTGALCEAR